MLRINIKLLLILTFSTFFMTNSFIFLHYVLTDNMMDEHQVNKDYSIQVGPNTNNILMNNVKISEIWKIKNSDGKLPPLQISKNNKIDFNKSSFRYVKGTACTNLVKSSALNQRVIYKLHYQHFIFKLNSPKHGFTDGYDSFLLNFYFDDRFVADDTYYVRTVVSIKMPHNPFLDENKPVHRRFVWSIFETPQYGYFWYEVLDYPVSVVCYTQPSAGIIRPVNGTYYCQYLISCPLPTMFVNYFPTDMSISSDQCSLPTTFKPILYPEKTIVENQKTLSTNLNDIYPENLTIGICIQPLFGSLDKSDASFIVSWMESLKLFGICEVTLTNGSLSVEDDIIKKVFDHYEESGFLIMKHYPLIHPYINNFVDQSSGSFAIKQMVMTDCFMRKIHKYDYVLVQDIDEIIVPQRHDTYQEYLLDYISKNNTVINDDCLSVRSAFFFRNIQQMESNNYPDYVPPLKFTTRHEPEPLGIPDQGLVGMSKSFSKMATLISVGCHLCRESHNRRKKPKHSFFPIDDILVHHYRKNCKSVHTIDSKCTIAEWENMSYTTDNSLFRFAKNLTPNVENVLLKIGYFNS